MVNSMNDYVSREAAIDALINYIHNLDRLIGTGRLTMYDCKYAAESVLGEDVLPSADAVEVVRCKDCIYPYIRGVDMYCDHITGEEILVLPHEFCCWGERKDGDTDG